MGARNAGRSTLGRHSKPPRYRYLTGPTTTGPVLAGVAAAICLTTTGSPATAATHPAPAHLAAVETPAGFTRAHVIVPAVYTIRPGDTLSRIAGHIYGDADAWPVLYWANHGQIRWADEITAGQVITVPALPARIPSPPVNLGPPAPAVTVTAAAPASTPAAATTAPAPAAASVTASYTTGSSFQQCVITRESGGDPQVMNSTGHYGLYQFSAATWAAAGGNPADFGDASVAEQNAVFAQAYAQWGTSPWAEWDGC